MILLDASDVSVRLPEFPPSGLRGVIHELREAHHLTQEELASRAGMTFGTVSRLESAKSAPAWATVMQFIDALGVTLPELAKAVEEARQGL